jgi:uncharacterized membrane protein YfcA
VIRALLASPLGFGVGLSLGALGSGGSILAVPALVYVAGQSPREATTTSLLLVGTAALFGLRSHLRGGRVDVRTGLAFGMTGIAGSFAGTALHRLLDPQVLLLGFSALILLAAWRMSTACPTCTRSGETHALGDALPRPRREPLTVRRGFELLAAGSAVGFLTGLFGVGGGFVIVPTLTLVLGFAMPQAIGTSLLVVAVNSAVALVARAGDAAIDWTAALAFTAAAVAGVMAGGRVADRIDAEKSLRFFAAGLVLLALFSGGSALVALI